MHSRRFAAEKLRLKPTEGCAHAPTSGGCALEEPRRALHLPPTTPFLQVGERGRREGRCSEGETPLWLTKAQRAHLWNNPRAPQKSSCTPPQYDKDIPLPGLRQPQGREETKRVYKLTRQETQARKRAPLGPLAGCIPQSLSHGVFFSRHLLAFHLQALPRFSGSSVTS